MNWNRAEELLEKYYAGTSSTAEEQELRELLNRPDLPRTLQQERALFNQMQLAGKQETSLSDEDLFARLDAELAKEKPAAKSIQLPLKALWQIAAAVALLAIGYWLGALQETEPAMQQTAAISEQSKQLAQIQKEVDEMKSLLTQNSPSQRIKAVNYVQETGDADEELIQVLIQTMHFDENVNVRMAAIKALLHFQERPLVRRALIQTLHIQTDPNVQLQLIDGLVEMGNREAVPEMQDLLQNKELQEVVKSRLQQGIGILI
jgi:HEAT repeat protein